MPLTRPTTGDPFDSGPTKSSTVMDEYADAIEALQAVDAIPQGGPLSEDLISDDKKLKGADDASATGGYFLPHAGDDAVSGGEAEIDGGNGAAGKPGGIARLQGGFGDAGSDSPSSVIASGGDGSGGDGLIQVTTGGSGGFSGEALVSDGSGNVIWDTPTVTAAIDVEDDGSAIGTFDTIDFGSGLDVTDNMDGSATIDATGGGSDSRLVISGKTADEGGLSSTVFQDDDHIAFTIQANEIWAFYLFLQYTETSSGAAKWRLDGPSGVSGVQVSNQATHLAPIPDAFAAGGEALTGGAGVYQRRGYITNGATGGTIKLQWAQNTASGALTVKKGSHLIAYKIA